MAAMPSILFEGYRIIFNRKGAFSHYMGGEFEGRGAECPNCKRLFVTCLDLDLCDERIRFTGKGISRLPLLYCLECELFHFPLVYRVERDGIRVLLALKSKRRSQGPASTIRHRRMDVDLSPVPPELERLAAKLNARQELSGDEEILFGQLTNNLAPPELGGYPVVDCYNQVGGRPFLIQRVEDPDCDHCPKEKASRMRFLASVCNERGSGIEIVPADMQILYFACPKCAAIRVEHSGS